jgi:hypothetical protein
MLHNIINLFFCQKSILVSRNKPEYWLTNSSTYIISMLSSPIIFEGNKKYQY